MADLTLVEAVNDALHTELARDRRRAGARRGRRPCRWRLPRDGGAARPVRRRPLCRHAARRGRDARHGGRSLHGRLAPRRRDAVRRVLLPVPRPADHARRALPLAHGRPDAVPDHDPDAVRRRGPRARAARRLTGDVLRAHAGDQGRDPVDSGRCEGAARRRDPRSRSGRDVRAEVRLPHGARRGAGGRARGAARAGADRARGNRRDADRLRRDGAGVRADGRRSSRARHRARWSTSGRCVRSTSRRFSRRSPRPAAS